MNILNSYFSAKIYFIKDLEMNRYNMNITNKSLPLWIIIAVTFSMNNALKSLS